MAKQKAIGANALRLVRQYFPKVTKVSDADTPVHIEVTPKDNASAQVRNHNGCAMAVAAKRTMKLDGVIVSISTIYTVKGNQATRYRVPPSVSREIVSFDRDAGFSTGEYAMIPPGKSHRLGRDSSSNKPQNKGSHSRGRFMHYTEGIRAALGSKRAPDGIVRSQK